MDEKAYTLKLTEQQITFILRALGELPYGQVAGLFQSIGTQINEQTAQKK